MVRLVDTVFSIYSLGLIAYAVLSWLKTAQTQQICSWLGRLYEPVLSRLRTTVKPVRFGTAMLDVTPAVLLLGLVLLKSLIIYLLPRGL